MAYKKSNPNGQATMANSEPIVIASDQSAVPVSGTVTANIGTVGTLSTAAKQDLLLTELQLKADLTETQPVSIAGSVAVTGPLTDTQLRATPVPVSGTVSTGGLTDTQLRATPVPVSNASLPLPSGASTSALQTTGNTSLSNIDTKVPALGQALAAASTPVVLTAIQQAALTPPAAITGFSTEATLALIKAKTDNLDVALSTRAVTGLTDTQIRATALPVSGTVAANATLNAETTKVIGTVNVAGTIPVSGTFWQATQPVSGTFFQATQPVSGTFFQATQPVSVPAEGVVSVVNSTIVNLSGAAVFTGTSEDLTIYASIKVSVFSSHASATDGLSIQQSSDGTNWDSSDVYTIPAVTYKTFSVSVNSKFFRLVYTNGATLTTSLRIQVLYNKSDKQPSSVRPQDARSNENDFVETLGFLMGYNGTSWDRLRSTIANGLLVDVSQAPAITKGTQGARGFATQALKDSGRNSRNFMMDAYTAAPAVEAVQSVVQWFGNAAVAGTTQPAVVTTGKTLRLTNYTISTKSLATVGGAVVRIRANTAGLGVLGSPLVFSMECGSRAGATTVAMTGGIDTFNGVFPEGLEFPAGTGLAFSMAGYGPTGTLALQGVTRFQVFGYEY